MRGDSHLVPGRTVVPEDGQHIDLPLHLMASKQDVTSTALGRVLNYSWSFGANSDTFHANHPD